jgi:xanthine dehydrogenase accessory factor
MLKTDVPVALCTVVSVTGSAPRRPGAKMWVFEDGSIQGSIGGGQLEKQVIADAIDCLTQKTPKLYKHDLLHRHNMCCGGNVHIFIEPIMPADRLYIFGAGHTGKALSEMAATCQFEVVVIDDRPEYIAQIENSGIHKMPVSFQKVLPTLPFHENTYVAIMTYSHPIDRDILFYCLQKPHAYLGMIGSLRKVEVTKKMFRDAGHADEEALLRVDMPMGLDIGAETPHEIAISILAKLIAVRSLLNSKNTIETR